jgi:serine/threonine protein kinase
VSEWGCLVSVEPLRPGDPRQIGPFRLSGYVGKGGFGTVYVGHQRTSARPVAVKLITVPPSADSTWHRRLAHEVEAIRRVGGEFTAGFVAADTDADPPWLATRYVSAPALDKLVQDQGPLSERGGWWLLSSVAEALLHIHTEGLLHRDLKPGNLLMARDGVKVIDFGLSKSMDGPTITKHATWAGTRFFAAPEQMDIRSATHKSDVYGLAATTVYAVAGHAPYTSATIQYWLHGTMPDLDGVPDGMYELLESCLLWDPANRPTVSEILEVALPRLLDQGVALFTDTVPPLSPTFLAAIMRHEEAAAVSAGPPPIAVVLLDDEMADADGRPGDEVAPGYLVSASSRSSGAAHNTDGSGGPRMPPGGHWAEQWNTAIDKRQDRYDG